MRSVNAKVSVKARTVTALAHTAESTSGTLKRLNVSGAFEDIASLQRQHPVSSSSSPVSVITYRLPHRRLLRQEIAHWRRVAEPTLHRDRLNDGTFVKPAVCVESAHFNTKQDAQLSQRPRCRGRYSFRQK